DRDPRRECAESQPCLRRRGTGSLRGAQIPSGVGQERDRGRPFPEPGEYSGSNRIVPTCSDSGRRFPGWSLLRYDRKARRDRPRQQLENESRTSSPLGFAGRTAVPGAELTKNLRGGYAGSRVGQRLFGQARQPLVQTGLFALQSKKAGANDLVRGGVRARLDPLLHYPPERAQINADCVLR